MDDLIVVNRRTGEIVDKRSLFPEPLNDVGYRVPSHRSGTRLFDSVPFPDEMSDADIGRMVRLSRLMVGNTNMLGYRNRGQISPYTATELYQISGMSERRGREFIRRMEEYRVIQPVTTNSGVQYYVNPAYFMRSGQRLTLDLFLLFRDELHGLLPVWVRHQFLSQAKVREIPYNPVAEAERILQEGV